MTQYAPTYDSDGYDYEPAAFYGPAPLALPDPEGVVAAYAFFYDHARSCVNLIDPETHPLTAEGTPGYFRDRVGVVCNVDNYFRTDIPSSDDMTLIAVCGVVKPVNSAGTAVLISNFDGSEGDELAMVAGFATLTARIDGDVLTVTAQSGRALEIGCSIEWTTGEDRFTDTLIAFETGSGGTGTYVLANDHGTVENTATHGGIAMQGRIPQFWAISQRSGGGADVAIGSNSLEVEGARVFLAATLGSADGNSAQVYKAVDGVLGEAMSDSSIAARSPVDTGTGALLIGRNPQGLGADVQVDMILIGTSVQTAEMLAANLAYLRGVYLPKFYSVAPAW